jgi:high-affinity Fe2+/Pb2+ permease
VSNRVLPAVGLVIYALGAISVSLRAFVPELVLDLGLLALAAGFAWLAVWLFRNAAGLPDRKN